MIFPSAFLSRFQSTMQPHNLPSLPERTFKRRAKLLKMAGKLARTAISAI
jgi:hypothetical protein